MDIRVLSQISGGGASASAVSVPADSRALISEIAASTGLSDTQRGGLIAAVAAADSGLSLVERTAALERIQRLGIYLRNTGNDGFPRWTMMTALRSYGMNLSSEAVSAPSAVSQALQQAVVDTGVSVETAVAVAATMVRQPVQQQPVKPAAKPVETTAPADVARVERIA